MTSPAGERVRVPTRVPALCTSAVVTRLSSGRFGRSGMPDEVTRSPPRAGPARGRRRARRRGSGWWIPSRGPARCGRTGRPGPRPPAGSVRGGGGRRAEQGRSPGSRGVVRERSVRHERKDLSVSCSRRGFTSPVWPIAFHSRSNLPKRRHNHNGDIRSGGIEESFWPQLHRTVRPHDHVDQPRDGQLSPAHPSPPDSFPARAPVITSSRM